MDQSPPPDEAERPKRLNTDEPSQSFARDKLRRSFDRSTYKKLHRKNGSNAGSTRNVDDLKKLFERPDQKDAHDVRRQQKDSVNRRKSLAEERVAVDGEGGFSKKFSRSVEVILEKETKSKEAIGGVCSERLLIVERRTTGSRDIDHQQLLNVGSDKSENTDSKRTELFNVDGKSENTDHNDLLNVDGKAEHTDVYHKELLKAENTDVCRKEFLKAENTDVWRKELLKDDSRKSERKDTDQNKSLNDDNRKSDHNNLLSCDIGESKRKDINHKKSLNLDGRESERKDIDHKKSLNLDGRKSESKEIDHKKFSRDSESENLHHQKSAITASKIPGLIHQKLSGSTNDNKTIPPSKEITNLGSFGVIQGREEFIPKSSSRYTEADEKIPRCIEKRLTNDKPDHLSDNSVIIDEIVHAKNQEKLEESGKVSESHRSKLFIGAVDQKSEVTGSSVPLKQRINQESRIPIKKTETNIELVSGKGLHVKAIALDEAGRDNQNEIKESAITKESRKDYESVIGKETTGFNKTESNGSVFTEETIRHNTSAINEETARGSNEAVVNKDYQTVNTDGAIITNNINFSANNSEDFQLRPKHLIQIKPLENQDIAQRVSNIEKLQSSLRKSLFEDTPILGRKSFTGNANAIQDSPIAQRRNLQENFVTSQSVQDKPIARPRNLQENIVTSQVIQNTPIAQRRNLIEDIVGSEAVQGSPIASKRSLQENLLTSQGNNNNQSELIEKQETTVGSSRVDSQDKFNVANQVGKASSKEGFVLAGSSHKQTSSDNSNNSKISEVVDGSVISSKSVDTSVNASTESGKFESSTNLEKACETDSVKQIKLGKEKSTSEKRSDQQESASIEEQNKPGQEKQENLSVGAKQSSEEDNKELPEDKSVIGLVGKRSTEENSTDNLAQEEKSKGASPEATQRVVEASDKEPQNEQTEKPVLSEEKKRSSLTRKSNKGRRLSTDRRVSFSPDIEHFPIPAPRKSPPKEVKVVTVEVKTVQKDSAASILLIEEGKKDVNSNYQSSEYESKPEEEEARSVVKSRKFSVDSSRDLIEGEDVLRRNPGRRFSEVSLKTYPEGILRKTPRGKTVDEKEETESLKKSEEEILRKQFSGRALNEGENKTAQYTRRSLDETGRKNLNTPKNRLSLAETDANSKTVFNILSRKNLENSPASFEKTNPFLPKQKSWRNSLISKPKTKTKPKLKEVKTEEETEIRYILPRQASEDSIHKIKSALDLFIMDDDKKDKKRTNSFKKIFRSFGKKDKDKDKEKKKPKKIENEIVGDNAQNESFNRNSKEVSVINKDLPEIPNEEEEKRYAQMHKNRYNQVRANFEQSGDYVCMDNGPKYTYINTAEVNKYIDTSSSSNTLDSENLAFRDSDNSSGLEKFLETPPRAFDTYQNVQLVKPKANIPISSERPLPLPYQDNSKNEEGTYGTVYDRKKSPDPSDRSLSSRSPSLEGSKLKLPANREKIELQPRIKSPIPTSEISTDKIIATELLKGKKNDKLNSPSHQRLEIEIDYPDSGSLQSPKGKPPVSPQSKTLQNLEAGEWHKKQREMHLSPSLEAIELQMKQMGRLSPGVEDWEKLNQMRDLDDWKKQRSSPGIDLQKGNEKQRNSFEEWQKAKQRNSLEEWQRKHMERVEDWQKKHSANEQSRLSPTIDFHQKRESGEDWQRNPKQDDNQKHRYVPMNAIQLSPIPNEQHKTPLSPRRQEQQKQPGEEQQKIHNSTVLQQQNRNFEGNEELIYKPPSSAEVQYQKNFEIYNTDQPYNRNRVSDPVEPERNRKISAQQEEFQKKFGRVNQNTENNPVSQQQVLRRQNSDASAMSQLKRQNSDASAGSQFQKTDSKSDAAGRNRGPNEFSNYQNDYEIYGQMGITRGTGNRMNNPADSYQNQLRNQNRFINSEYQKQMNQNTMLQNQTAMDYQKQQNQNTMDYQKQQNQSVIEYQKQLNQNRQLESQHKQNLEMDSVDYQKQVHQHNLIEWQRLHSKPPIERKVQSQPVDQRRPGEDYQRRLQSPPKMDYQQKSKLNSEGFYGTEEIYGSNQRRVGNQRKLSEASDELYQRKEGGYQEKRVPSSEVVFRSNQQNISQSPEEVYGSKMVASEVIYGTRATSQEGVYGSKMASQEAIYGSKGSSQEAMHGKLSPQEATYGSKLSPQEIAYGSKVPSQEAMYGNKLSPQEAMYGSKMSPQEAMYGSKLSSQEATYGSKMSPQEAMYGSKVSSQEATYGSKVSSQEAMYGSKVSSQEAMYGSKEGMGRNFTPETYPPSEAIYGSKTSPSGENVYGQKRVPSTEGIYGSNQMTTNVQVHVDSHSPQNRSVTPVSASRSTTPVNLRSPSHLSLLQRTPPKHEIRQSVEAFCWKELKKMKEQEDIQMQIQLSNYGYLEDPIISHRSRSMSPSRARNSRRSSSLPREVQRQRRLDDAGMGKVREPIYGQRVVYNANQNFARNSPQRSTIGTTGVSNGQRPIFNRGSLTQSFNKDQQALYYKRVGFHSPQNPENPQAWPTKNGYTQSPPQRRIEIKKEASLEDDVFLPDKPREGVYGVKGGELTREEIFMMNQQRQRLMKEPNYAFRPLPNEPYRQNGVREPIYGSRPQNRNEIYGTRLMPNIREEGYQQKTNIQRNNSFTQRYDLPPGSEPIYGRNPNEIYGRLTQRPSTVNNKVCDMYGKIHDNPVQQSGVLYGQLQRNANAPPMQYQSYSHIQNPPNFVRGSRLTASVNDMNRYYHQPPDRPLPPIPNDRKQRRPNNPDESGQKNRIAGK